MPRIFRSTRRYDKQMAALEKPAFKQAIKAMQLFMDDPARPSLRVKKVQGTANFFELRVNRSLRIIIEITNTDGNEVATFFIIGTHDEVFPPQ